MSPVIYKKAPLRQIPLDEYASAEVIPVLPAKKEFQPVTLWSLATGIKNDLVELVQSSSVAGLIIPATFILLGFIILGQQILPEVDQHLKRVAGYYDQGTTPLVGGEYIAERIKYLSDPGSKYFQELTNKALGQDILQNDPFSSSYQGTIYLSIPSLGFNRLPVQANVESGVESVYNSVLKTKLAHFKSTGLPASSVQNNIVIYGHSARSNYKATPSDPSAAFSFLTNLRIGDEIFLEMNGVQYKFIMTRSKIVEPDDTEIVTGSPGRRTLTLFTCYPNGVNSNRYVAIARPA